ncbi:CLUMA_CG002816, isoform A [Clunio marinus]|uniref:CLUMA_CG002816, isoform A n=1 Tax=Clunio marinus TaxID=568069 RepID=A0A1J1HM44_9DIPT|nr:CLUMA_CG002816, isoform A [Clunio marinus]
MNENESFEDTTKLGAENYNLAEKFRHQEVRKKEILRMKRVITYAHLMNGGKVKKSSPHHFTLLRKRRNFLLIGRFRAVRFNTYFNNSNRNSLCWERFNVESFRIIKLSFERTTVRVDDSPNLSPNIE